MPDAGDLFASVTSGTFDNEASPEESAWSTYSPMGRCQASSRRTDARRGRAQDDAGEVSDASAAQDPVRRVLAPDVEAPKLQKVLAQAGVGSRRDLEQMIVDKRVTVNEEIAHTGQRVSWGDRVAVDGKPVRVRIAPLPARVIAYHKPAGEVVSHDDPQQRPTVFRRLPRLAHGKWQSVGRLDINTEGLLLFTTSGELANQLMHRRFGVEREYAVRVLGTLDDRGPCPAARGGRRSTVSRLPSRASKTVAAKGANHWYRVVITEGRNREVRNLFDAVGLTVSRLIRIRYGRWCCRAACGAACGSTWPRRREAAAPPDRLGGQGGQGDGTRRTGNKRDRGGRDDAGPRPARRTTQWLASGSAWGRAIAPRTPAARRARAARAATRSRQPCEPSHGKQRQQAGFGDAAVHAQESTRTITSKWLEVSEHPQSVAADVRSACDPRGAQRAARVRRRRTDSEPLAADLRQAGAEGRS